MMKFSHLLLLGIVCFPLFLRAEVERLATPEEQQINNRQRQQQNALNSSIQAQQVKSPDIHLQSEKLQSRDFPRNEAQCFPIQQIVLTDIHRNEANPSLIQPSRFSWALSAVYSAGDFSLPACIGSQGINVLLRRIQNRLIDFGYITTRVVVEPQDLRSGMLILTVIPGRVGHIQLQDHSAIPFATRGTLWFAMPMAQGEILNVRDLEQGLENLKRIPSADANMELQATENIGESDIIIQYKQSLPFHLTLGLDDAGSKATGRLQGSATFSWDNVTTLNDLFYFSASRSFKRHSDNAQGDYGSKNYSLYYSIPWKNTLLTLSGSKYQYHQTIAGAFESYDYSGESRQMNATLKRLLWRNSRSKTYLNFSLWTRQSSNFINDTEVQVQRRRTAGWEAGLQHTHYIGNATLQLSANYKRGTGANRALPAPEEKFDEGTSRMQIITASVDLAYPFMLGKQPFRFSTHWNAQWNQTPLVQQDKLSIGGRYTVRGFDGELSLSGERGWVWRNELAWNIANKGQEFYLGIDKGIVRSSQEELQLGDSLTGGVLGLRGELWGLNYDYFIGIPIKKPEGFRTSHLTTGFSFSYRF
ncbi:ShlB/FhaC/HecB family hemolysin secretion/activation protein [Avibacterium paragallinarum]|uniref:ShlB/FhaC/HecB family hemolysin secretion/activation protein n=1 Tax=Avibacterium paragallinarum TaxID=728 RepID=A0ABU7QR70_AVIPA|nr:ShlB/FhaC/HecB family hemolysin secretion/activation protein [Avibacterium paragallinarum]